MTDRELMQMALEELESLADVGYGDKGVIQTLRDRLAQPEPEPVAWICHQQNGVNSLWWMKDQAIDRNAGHQFTPLYTAPPKREWVGLTDEDIEEICWTEVDNRLASFAYSVEAKLKEKNT